MLQLNGTTQAQTPYRLCAAFLTLVAVRPEPRLQPTGVLVSGA